jgi:hypothetical protein
MKVELALLADHALAHEDGKIYVTGGLLEVIYLDTFPGIHPNLSLVLRLSFGPLELGKRHQISVRVSDQHGRVLPTPEVDVPVVPTASSSDAETVQFQCVFNFRDLVLPREGEYVLSVRANEVEVHSLKLRALLSGEQEARPTLATSSQHVLIGPMLQTPGSRAGSDAEAEVNRLLNRGYEVFAQGSADEAEAIFAGILTRFPDDGRAHNNLGFVLLSKGSAADALDHFRQAAQLGYGHSHLLNMNTGVCLFLIGDLRSALATFITCLQTGAPAQAGLLFALDDSRIWPTAIESPGDYLALAALNAGWTALRLNDHSTARQLAEIAAVGLYTFAAGSPQHIRFRHQVRRLRSTSRPPPP